MVRATFTAMPARRVVLAAKAATAAAFVFPLALGCDVVSFELGQRILAAKHIQVALSHPGTLQALIFGAVAASLVTIVGVGLAGVIRHTAGAVTALAMLILGGAILGQMLPAGLRQYIPGIAVQAAVTVHRSAGLLRPARPSWSCAPMPPSPSGRHQCVWRTATPEPVPVRKSALGRTPMGRLAAFTNLDPLEAMDNAVPASQCPHSLFPSPLRSTWGRGARPQGHRPDFTRDFEQKSHNHPNKRTRGQFVVRALRELLKRSTNARRSVLRGQIQVPTKKGTTNENKD